MAAESVQGGPGFASSDSHPLVDSYRRWILDPLVVLAQALYDDYVADPRRYRQASEQTIDSLARFRATGVSSHDSPDDEHRTQYYVARFGQSFWVAGATLREAAIALVEHPSDGGQYGVHRRVFDDATGALRAYLSTLGDEESSANSSQTGPVFDRAVDVFKSGAVAGAFGSSPPTDDAWPFTNDMDADAAYLVERVANSTGHEPQIITQTRFLNLQRVAHYGGLTIAGVLEANEADQNDELVQNAYMWAKALQNFVPDIVRAWRDRLYRQSLSSLERSLMPDNPAGEIDLTSSGLETGVNRLVGEFYAVAGTYTVSGEVCCCDSIQLCDSLAPICTTLPPQSHDPLMSLGGLCSWHCFDPC
jgi:mersacidin/lichenicidin family type 2 lantibiotic